jgi:Uma2 family endonuclease
MPEAQRRIDFDEYLALERAGEVRHEYLRGELFAMVGASRAHNSIVTRLVVALHTRLAGRGCEVYSNDMRVRVEATDFVAYPDVVVACGEPHFHDAHTDTLLDPVLIVEVLSPSTSDYDRGSKFAHYRSIPSLRDYLLVAQDEVRVEHFAAEQAGTWRFSETRDPAAVIDVPSVGCRLPLAEVYEGLLGTR